MPTLVIFPAIDVGRLERLQAAVPAVRITNAESLETAEAAMPVADAFFGKLTAALLKSAGRLRWVQSPTASLEHYLFPELVEHTCTLTNMRGLFSDVVADHVMGFILTFARNLHLYQRQQQQALWAPCGDADAGHNFAIGPGVVSPVDQAHVHLADTTLGVVGVGHIGAEVCRRGRAFGMRVIGVDPRVRAVAGVTTDIWPLAQLDALLAVSDWVVIAAPHTPKTAQLFDRDRLRKMKPSARLINVGRGAIVKLHDLTLALQAGELAGAALDVFEVEPLPVDHVLWRLPNVLITPHVAAASPRIAERHFATLLENLTRFTSAQELINVVDKAEWC